MPIISANERLGTVKPQGRVVVCNPTRRSLPRSGRNGTSSQFSDGSIGAVVNPVGKVPTKHGNTFGNNRFAIRTPVATNEKRFGQRSNVAIATDVTVSPYVSTAGPHPNAHFHDVARQPKRAPMQPGSPEENNSNPAGVFSGQPNAASNVMPHLRNGIGANQGKNLSKRATYRAAAGGANKTLPSDTPFHKMAVKRQPSRAQTTGVPEPPDSTKDDRARVPSFRTRSNLWYDPNNSFAHGATSTATGRSGVGRWNIVKRGAAG